MMIFAGDSVSRAYDKTGDIHMSLKDNPLRADFDILGEVRHKNMVRLRRDAEAWQDPKTGEAYRAIRSMVHELS